MKIFTIDNGEVIPGSLIKERLIAGQFTVKGIIIGQPGRGRKVGFLPLAKDVPTKKDNNGETEWVFYGSLGRTYKNAPKLIKELPDDRERVLCVLRTHIGFRGHNSHTGVNEDTFPGEKIIEGMIAQGAAGRAGYGDQYICTFPVGAKFKTSYTGRLYGKPSSHIYVVESSEKILGGFTEEEYNYYNELIAGEI
ncbi:MAG: hypothetical protein DRP08_01375 [Candidatus Aenigmatarchaeota archaeon]|nr:MAG: hypothetical protein DRP08_01375 [Candidatus Aenigmarchaeota archaeon]